MRTLTAGTSALLLIDLQVRLMTAIEGAGAVIARASRLLEAARLLGVPALATEHNAKGLGPMVPELKSNKLPVFPKMTFDSCRAEGFLERLPDRAQIVLAGCEAHVCLLQTGLGLIDAGRKVYVVGDAVGSRHARDRRTALRRLAAHGAEIVTVEMVLFEWLERADHPCFREVMALIKANT